MSGDGLIRPLNAPAAAPLSPGVQPGTSAAIIRAVIVIISGSGAGVFVYNGTPSASNPPIFWATSATADPFGNAIPSTVGIASTGTFQAGNTITTPSGTVGYSGTPAANNMLYSSAPAAFTDASGNSVLAGVTAYGKSGAVYYAINQLPGTDASGTFGALMTVYTGSAMSSWTAGSQVNLAASDHLGLLADRLDILGITGAPLVQLHDGTTLLSVPAQLSATSSGMLNVAANGGFSGTTPNVQTDSGTNTNANSGGALRLSAIYTIPANDLQVGTEYVIEMPFSATMEGNTLELGLSIDGSNSFTVNNTISGTIVGSGVGINGHIRVGLMCTATGAGGTITAWTDGSVNQTSAATTFANSGGLAGNIATGVALDTTASHTIRVNSLWGGSNVSQTASGRTSTCTKKGP